MKPAEPIDLAERALIRRKREDAALAVPALGLLLLVSPVLNIFAGGGMILGLPAAYVWIFAVWTGLVLMTFGLARRIQAADDRNAPDSGGHPEAEG
ncbi:hypothetical protein ACW9UR_19055 [Halovulum sp. GXIMD14794]